MIRQIAYFFTAMCLLAGASAGADSVKPLVIKNGQTQQIPATDTLAVPKAVRSGEIGTTLDSYSGVAASRWYSQGHPNWNIVQTLQNYNPTEWQVYSASGQGKAHCGNPGVDGTVVLDSGTLFDGSWIGVGGFYIQPSGSTHGAYTVQSVTDTSHLTLTTTCVGAGSTTFHYVSTLNSGTVNISGTSVTWAGGMPFNVFSTATGAWNIGGVVKTCSAITLTSATCDTSGTSSGVAYTSWNNIDNEVVNLRLQKVLGSNEENLTCMASATGFYKCTPQFGGVGQLWPFYLGNGNYSVGGGQHYQVSIETNGDLNLGGPYLQSSVLVPAVADQSSSINPLVIAGGISGSFPAPNIRARACGTCVETNVNLGFDTLGTGNFTFTSHSFASTEFEIFGVGAASHLAVSSHATQPFVSAVSSAADASIRFIPKGSGTIIAAAPLQLPAYTVGALPTCNAGRAYAMAAVTDATAPTYNGVLTGGGAVKIPVFCDGTAWTAH